MPTTRPGRPAISALQATQTALRWYRRKKVVGSIASVLLITSAAVTAAILIQQDVTVSGASQDSDVKFVDGTGGVAGFATVAIGTSGASATISLTGIAGASLQVTDLLRIQNTDATQAYTVTLSRSGAPNAAIESLVFTVLDGVTTIKSFDAASAASATAFTLPVSTTYDIRINVGVADGTAAGPLGSLALQFSIAPA